MGLLMFVAVSFCTLGAGVGLCLGFIVGRWLERYDQKQEAYFNSKEFEQERLGD